MYIGKRKDKLLKTCGYFKIDEDVLKPLFGDMIAILNETGLRLAFRGPKIDFKTLTKTLFLINMKKS